MGHAAALALVTFGIIAALNGDGAAQSDTSIRSFRIDVPDAVLADLKARLKSPRIEFLKR